MKSRRKYSIVIECDCDCSHIITSHLISHLSLSLSFTVMKRAVSLAVCAVGVLGSMASAGHLRAPTNASVVAPECDPFQKNPCVQHNFVTPQIMEEKAYDETSGVFIEHKLSSQEAAGVKAKVESGVEEVKEAPKDGATGASSPEMEGEGQTNPLLKEAAKEERELSFQGLGKYEKFVEKTKRILDTHNGHRHVVSKHAERAVAMVEKLKAELEQVKAAETKARKEHADLAKHTKIALLMAKKKAVDADIQQHADKLKVLDAEQEQLRKRQVHHIGKIDALKQKLDAIHQEIMGYKQDLGIGRTADVSKVDAEEEEVEKSAVDSADDAEKGAGKKALAEAKVEEKGEGDVEAYEDSDATGGATAGGATGKATGAATAAATGGETAGSSTGSNDSSTGVEEGAVAAGLEKKIAEEEAKLKALES